MLKLSSEQTKRLAEYIKADRQWKRPHRIAYARLMLKYAWAKEDKDDIAFYRAVIINNEFDMYDKKMRHVS